MSVLGVVGGSGGVGASSFAGALAAAAASAVLVDLDPVSGGLDVVLGIEDEPGARWSGLRLDGGHLDPALLASGLPLWNGVPVLAVDSVLPSPSAVVQLIETAGWLGCVVLDLPRAPSPTRAAAVARCELVVLVAACGVRGLAAARAVLAALEDAPVGVVLRRGPVPVGDAAHLIGAPLLGVLPALAVEERPLPRVARRVAAGVMDGVLAGVRASP